MRCELWRRRSLGQDVVDAHHHLPSSAGTLRGPNKFGKEWRNAREELGVPEVTTHGDRSSILGEADRRVVWL
jgi:hypothetical protein